MVAESDSERLGRRAPSRRTAPEAVQLEHARDERASDRVDVDAPGGAVVDVPDMGDTGEVALFGLLATGPS